MLGVVVCGWWVVPRAPMTMTTAPQIATATAPPAAEDLPPPRTCFAREAAGAVAFSKTVPDRLSQTMT